MRIKIADVRKEKRISQKDLADKVGMSRPYLAQIENETRNLSTKRLYEIAQALEVEAGELVDFNAPSPTEEEYILESFRRLTPEQRREWLSLARVATGIAPPQDQ